MMAMAAIVPTETHLKPGIKRKTAVGAMRIILVIVSFVARFTMRIFTPLLGSS